MPILWISPDYVCLIVLLIFSVFCEEHWQSGQAVVTVGKKMFISMPFFRVVPKITYRLLPEKYNKSKCDFSKILLLSELIVNGRIW